MDWENKMKRIIFANERKRIQSKSRAAMGVRSRGYASGQRISADVLKQAFHLRGHPL